MTRARFDRPLSVSLAPTLLAIPVGAQTGRLARMVGTSAPGAQADEEDWENSAWSGDDAWDDDDDGDAKGDAKGDGKGEDEGEDEGNDDWDDDWDDLDDLDDLDEETDDDLDEEWEELGPEDEGEDD